MNNTRRCCQLQASILDHLPNHSASERDRESRLVGSPSYLTSAEEEGLTYSSISVSSLDRERDGAILTVNRDGLLCFWKNSMVLQKTVNVC